MGQSISDVRKEAKAATEQQKQEFQERLQILEKLIHQRLDNEKNNILNGEKHDQEIDTGTIVSLHKMVYIKQTSGESEDMKKAIHQIFFWRLYWWTGVYCPVGCWDSSWERQHGRIRDNGYVYRVERECTTSLWCLLLPVELRVKICHKRNRRSHRCSLGQASDRFD